MTHIGSGISEDEAYCAALSDIADNGKIDISVVKFKFGGPGCVVRVDESVVTRRKYNRGRVVKEKWVLGIYDTSVRRGVVLFVCKRDRQTLVPLIRDYVLPGSRIYTDGWSAYTGLDRAGYTHMVVNHKKHFVDPTPGACTNAVESLKKLQLLNTSCGYYLSRLSM
ncbi:hypothetical protein C0J52_10727 [Blattella germanica]|nr:hypothetical protein C0J52_10727 [Blattella germanica]